MNTVMQTINNMYKKTPSLEETELSKLESLLTKVGGNAKSILLKADEISMAEFLDTCIRNGITFELHENRLKEKGSSEKETSYEGETSSHSSSMTDDNSLCTQSPSEKEKACEKGCVEAESCGERITLENWKELSIKVGDEVYIGLSGDGDFESDSTYTITKLYEGERYTREECFLRLQGLYYDYDNMFEHELYLIRTPEGSLHDK